MKNIFKVYYKRYSLFKYFSKYDFIIKIFSGMPGHVVAPDVNGLNRVN